MTTLNWGEDHAPLPIHAQSAIADVDQGESVAAQTPMLSNHEYPIEGFIWRFGEADLVQDEVMPGAIRDSLGQRSHETVKMLFQHDPSTIIGRWVSISETALGVYVNGLINLKVQRGRELAALIETGGVDGLSIGFQTRRARRDPETGRRQIFALDLWEISIVPFPMLNSARLKPAASSQPLTSSLV